MIDYGYILTCFLQTEGCSCQVKPLISLWTL